MCHQLMNCGEKYSHLFLTVNTLLYTPVMIKFHLVIRTQVLDIVTHRPEARRNKTRTHTQTDNFTVGRLGSQLPQVWVNPWRCKHAAGFVTLSFLSWFCHSAVILTKLLFKSDCKEQRKNKHGCFHCPGLQLWSGAEELTGQSNNKSWRLMNPRGGGGGVWMVHARRV